VGTEDRVVGGVFAKLLANDGSRETRTVVNRLFVAEPGDLWRQKSPPAHGGGSDPDLKKAT
jgi:hypothetical protein